MEEFVSKSEELNKIIEKLYMVSSEADCEEICKDFDKIYLNEDGSLNEQFRHEYSSVSGKIKELNAIEMDGEKVYALEFLLENMNSVYDYACKEQKRYLKNLFKLKDHIGLEAGRISLVDQLKWQIATGNESIEVQLKRMDDLSKDIGKQIDDSTELIGDLREAEKVNEENIEKSKDNLDELLTLSENMKEKVESIHRDSITILGIFASIVLTFSGGMIFSTSVLENIGNASAYRIIIIALIIGFVLLNSIIALIMYIGKIVRVKREKKGIGEVIKENAFWISINAIIVTLIILTYIGWNKSSEKALLDESNKYQIEMHHKNTEELKTQDISENDLEENEE